MSAPPIGRVMAMPNSSAMAKNPPISHGSGVGQVATSAPHHQTGAPSRSNTMRTKPYTATLVMTPLIKAETWLGAAGCATGSQTCSGTSPAFEPAPTSASASTTPAMEADGAAARTSSNE